MTAIREIPKRELQIPNNSISIEKLINIASLTSPDFTGAPTAPTPTTADDSTKIATTAFVQAQPGGGGGSTFTLLADAELSGAPKILKIFDADGVTPFYIKAYPNKT